MAASSPSGQGAHNRRPPVQENTTEESLEPMRAPSPRMISPQLRLPSVNEMLLGVGRQPELQQAPGPSAAGRPPAPRSRQSPSFNSQSRIEDEGISRSPSWQLKPPHHFASGESSASIARPDPSPSHQGKRRRKPVDSNKPRAAPRRFPCLVPGCGKTLARPSALKTHMRIHSKEKPYVCPVAWCGRGFSVYSNMVRHQRLCNHPTPIPGEEPLPPPTSYKGGALYGRPSTSNDPLTSSEPLSSSNFASTSALPQSSFREGRQRASGVVSFASDGPEMMDAMEDDGEEEEEEEDEEDELAGETEGDEDERAESSSWATASPSADAPSPTPPSRHSLLALLSDAAALTPTGSR
ncbi:hypothetical protein T439DRAFT_327897 [Meredithblackwellia eburnea MCA 4105]